MVERGQAIMTSGHILEGARLDGSSLVPSGTHWQGVPGILSLWGLSLPCAQRLPGRRVAVDGVSVAHLGTSQKPACRDRYGWQPSMWLKGGTKISEGSWSPRGSFSQAGR